METMLESIGKGTASHMPIPAAPGTLLVDSTSGELLEPAVQPTMRHARSFLDCEEVLLQAAISDPRPTHSPSPRRKCDLLGGELAAVQEDEDEMAQVGSLGGFAGVKRRLDRRCSL